MTLRDYILQQWPDLAAQGNYPAIAEAGNAATAQPNPEAQGQTPKHITLKRVMQIVPASEMAAAYTLAGFVDDVRRAIDADDRGGVGGGVGGHRT